MNRLTPSLRLNESVLELRDAHFDVCREIATLEKWIAMREDPRFQELRTKQLRQMRRAEALVGMLSKALVARIAPPRNLVAVLDEAIRAAAQHDCEIRAIWKWFPGAVPDWSKRIYTPLVAKYLENFDAGVDDTTDDVRAS